MSAESDFLKKLREASLKTTVEQLRILHRLKEARSDWEEAAEGTVASASPEKPSALGDFLFDVARLQLSAYNDLLGLSATYADQVIAQLRAITQPRRSTTAPPHLAIALSGTAGTEASAPYPFVIENRLSQPAEVALSVSEFRSTTGGPHFSAKVGFRAEPPTGSGSPPDDRHLEPGTQRGFVMTVQLDPPFQGGQRYAAEVHVALRGRVVEVVDVQVDVKPSSAAASQRRPVAKKRTTAVKTRRRHGKA